MKIEKKTKPVWISSDNTEHESLDAAKCHEIVQLAALNPLQEPASFPTIVAEWIVANGDAIAAILRTKARKPRTVAAKKRGRPAGSKNQPATEPAQ